MAKRPEKPLVPRYMTVSMAGFLYFGWSRETSRQAANRGDLPTVTLPSGKRMVSVERLEAMLKERENKGCVDSDES